MSEATLSALSQDKQNRILNAAKERFLHYGVSKTTMRDIADDLGIAVSNLYLYFENKRELVLAIAQNCRAEQEQAAGQVLSNASLRPSRKLEQLLVGKFRAIQSFRTDSPNGKELMAYLLQEFPERHAEWHASLERAIQTALQEGVETGCFRIADVPETARLLRLATAFFFLPPFVELPRYPEEEELVALIRWHLALLEGERV
jgi:AcrR family transcriptional regulator